MHSFLERELRSLHFPLSSPTAAPYPLSYSNMYYRLAVSFLALFAAAVVAAPNNPVTVTVTRTETAAAPTQTVVDQCNTGMLFSSRQPREN